VMALCRITLLRNAEISMVQRLPERRLCVCNWCYMYTTLVINNVLTFCKKLSLNYVNFSNSHANIYYLPACYDSVVTVICYKRR
jgi:hypothetical protein